MNLLHNIIMKNLCFHELLRGINWKFGLLAEEKAIKEDNPELRYLIINKFGDINMSYKYCVCPFEGGNYNIVEINYIGNNMKPNIEIDRGR